MKKIFFLVVILCRVCFCLDLSDVVFHHSFDNGLNADMSRGKKEPVEVYGKIDFFEGKKGKAIRIVNNQNYIVYDLKDKFPTAQGAISFWISPYFDKDIKEGIWDGSMADVLQVVFHTDKKEQQIVIQQLWPRRSFLFVLFDKENPVGGFPSCLVPGVPLSTGHDAESVLKAGKWYHMLFTWQPGKITTYLNGKLIAEYKTPEIKVNTSFEKIYIGWNRKEGQLFIDPGCDNVAKPISEKPWQTLIDDFTIFNKYIFPPQAEKIYQEGAIEYARKAEPNPLSLDVSYYPYKNKIKANIFSPGEDVRKGKLVVENKANNKIVYEQNFILEQNEENKTIEIIKNLDDGDYLIYASLLKDGQVLFTSEKQEIKRKKFEWEKNKLGSEDIVLPPWTPVEIKKEKDSVKMSVWGRTHTFLNNNPFPVSIVSQGREILNSGISLILKDGEKEITPLWENLIIRGITPNKTKVNFEAEGKLGLYKVNIKSRLEYDGMLWYEVTFSSEGERKIEKLYVDVPVKKELCKLFQYSCSRNYWFPKNYWSSDFMPYLWVGNDDIGIQWFAEKDQYWYAKEQNKKLEVLPEKDKGIMRINIIRDEVLMPKEFTVSFGFIATPVRERPKDFRTWAYHSDDLPWRLGEPEKYKNLKMDYSWWSISPGWLIPKSEPGKYNPNKPIMWVPFTSSRFLGAWRYDSKSKSDFIDEWKVFKDEWIQIPEQIGGEAPGWNEAQINPSESYIDFYVYYVDKFFKNYNVDGLYFDGYAGAQPSSNIEVGFGYVDRDGKIKPVYPILAGRELHKRIYAIIKKYRPEKGVVIIHPATFLIMPVMSFSDGNFDGENMVWADLRKKIIDSKGWYSAALTKDWLRATYNMRPFGLVPNFDCRLYLSWAGSGDRHNLRARELFGLLMAHDIFSWGGWTEGYARSIGVTLDWWGICDENVEFLPYWDEEPAVTVRIRPDGKDNEWDSCYASAWINHKNKKMLIVCLNISPHSLTEHRYKKEGNLGYFLNLNLKKLGLEGKKIKVSDAESLGKLKLNYNNGLIPLNMEPHEIKIINVEWDVK